VEGGLAASEEVQANSRRIEVTENLAFGVVAHWSNPTMFFGHRNRDKLNGNRILKTRATFM
jgi:hypothetical protein